MKPIPIEQRFWAHVDKRGEDDCWLWLGKPGTDGYGKTSIKYTTIRAHRMSWMLHYGDIPPGLSVLHNCDNPLCVNPSHLFLGTTADNMRDKARKGRSGARRLTTPYAIVKRIRILYQQGSSIRKLARKFDLAPRVVRDIVHGRTHCDPGGRPPRTNNTSGAPGVAWNIGNNKWVAYINYRGKRIHLGVFTSWDEAVNARRQAEKVRLSSPEDLFRYTAGERIAVAS